MRGWIYTKPANFFESQQGRTTTASRQILVTHVGEKSPADGVMQVDDVILGAGGKLFTDDARKSIARAIQEAEKEANGGRLKLTRWRAGKTNVVQLHLRVMGTYSVTAPCGWFFLVPLVNAGSPDHSPGLTPFVNKRQLAQVVAS